MFRGFRAGAQPLINPARWADQVAFMKGSQMFLEQIGLKQRLLLTVAAILALGACSGSDSGNFSEPTESVAAATEPSNVIIGNTSVSVQKEGGFEAVDGYLSQSSKTLRASSSGGSANATFNAMAEKQGFYEVFAWWPQSGGEDSRARIRIAHRAGETAVTVDQSRGGGEWHSLGIHEFDAGAGSIVFEQIEGASMLVDAVRVQYVGDTRPALALQSPTLAVAELDIEYSVDVSADGGVRPYAYEVVGGMLPPGLVMNRETGRISGVPGRIGGYELSVEARDADGKTAVADFQIEVIEPSAALMEPEGASAPMTMGAPLVTRSAPIVARSFSTQSTGAGLDGLISIVAAMPEGSWRKVNENLYSEVWTPSELMPLFAGGTPKPSKIISAWSSFTWDSKRGNLLIYGGGHANYRGNDVYLWRGATRRWERASLPSESLQDALGNWNAVDGAANAPASAHTYDNTVYLPIIDRMLVLGGAADSNGGHYYTANDAGTAKRITGPYLFDPAKAHPDQVGGTTGSHVKRVAPYPDVVGGQMWSNRENWLNGTGAAAKNFVDACTAYSQEGGMDVVYVYLNTTGVYRYQITSLNEPALDTWSKVGRYWGGPGAQTACGYDPVGKSLVRVATNATPFVFFDLNKAGPKNDDVRLIPADPTGEFAEARTTNALTMKNCGLDFDSERRQYALWCGGGTVWMLEPPATLTASSSGWTIRKQPTPVGEVPLGSVGVGVMGKWKYIPNLDAFIALQDSVEGNIWVYKPVGWKLPEGGGDPGDPGPVNQPPEVTLIGPLNGAAFTAGQAVPLLASASDSDGSVVTVEFFADGVSVGSVAAAPYALAWHAPIGAHRIAAVVTDDGGAQAASTEVLITVQPSHGGGDLLTVKLQRGVNAYDGVSDTYLSEYHQSLSFGSSTMIQDQANRTKTKPHYYSGLVRFAIFQSEGGPVPDGAQIESAKLSIYKYTAYDVNYALYPMLKAWSESATWLNTGLGAGWASEGANAMGVDYHTEPDATASTSWASGQWVEFDVSAAVRRYAQGGEPGNHGWRLKGLAGTVASLKRFYTSNYATDEQFRPKLEITYR